MSFKHTLYASYLGYITQAIVNNLMPLLFVTFNEQFDISLGKIGLLISINFFVQIIVDLLAARYVDDLGYRLCIVLAHILSIIGLVGLGILPFVLNTYIGLLIATILNAISGGLIEVLVSPIVESLPGEQKDQAMSLLHSFYCWGHVGVVLLSTIYFNLIGLNQWFYLPIIWALVPLFNTFLFMKVPLNQIEANQEHSSFKYLFSSKLFWILFVLMICSGASEQAMSQWSSLFCELGLNVSKTVGDLLGPCAFALCMGSARLFYGIKGERLDLRKCLFYSGIGCVVSYLMAILSPIPLISLLGCALSGLSVGMMWPGVFSLTSQIYPNVSTTLFALLALAGDVGCSIGPGVVGVVSEYSGELKLGLAVAILFPLFLVMTLVKLKNKKLETLLS